ncbi:MAG: hypothetical protein LQ337_002841 [Flavoplaca oasis]|nr:MAG: hypothetical protein LQ337_002841 [Flavoplaca oasis]
MPTQARKDKAQAQAKAKAKAKTEKEDLGTKYAAHWTPAEHASKSQTFADVEVARKERRENYATVAEERAIKYAKEEGLLGDGPGQAQYQKGDFMHLPFPDNHFDFVYAIEATVHASSLEAVYTEIARVLKPGAVFGVYEWLMTGTFDDKNEVHVDIRQRIERGNGVVAMSTVKEGLEAFRASG